jgi:hypothetical protein
MSASKHSASPTDSQPDWPSKLGPGMRDMGIPGFLGQGVNCDTGNLALGKLLCIGAADLFHINTRDGNRPIRPESVSENSPLRLPRWLQT